MWFNLIQIDSTLSSPHLEMETELCLNWEEPVGLI